MKKRIIVTSLIMASVLPFIGGIESVRADEATSFIDKTKSDLDQAKEKLRLAQAEKENLENKLQQAKSSALKIEEEKQQDLDKRAKIEENLKANEVIIAKEQKINELLAEEKALDERVKIAEMDLDNAQIAYNEAQKAYETEKENQKKNLEGNSQLLKALDEKVKETKKDLDTKLEEMKKLEKEDERLRKMRESLGDLKAEDIIRAKAQVEKDKKEIEEINSHIKTLEKSDELARVRSIEDQIQALNKKIDRLNLQIESLKKANDNKPSDNKTNKPENKETNKPDGKNKKPASDKRGLEGNFIDFSKLKMEKNDNKIRLKYSYQKLKEAVNRAKKIVSLAENYAKSKKMSTNKRRELLRLIEELKETIRFIEDYMEKLALSI